MAVLPLEDRGGTKCQPIHLAILTIRNLLHFSLHWLPVYFLEEVKVLILIEAYKGPFHSMGHGDLKDQVF